MRKKLLSLLFIVLVSTCSFSQSVGIRTTTPDAYTALDITATRNERPCKDFAILPFYHPAKSHTGTTIS